MSNGFPDVSTNFYDLSQEQQKFIVNWMEENFLPIQKINSSHTAYGLKQNFTAKYFYVTQEQFTTAMIKAGFKAKKVRSNSGNYMFNIGERSPYLQSLKHRAFYDED